MVCGARCNSRQYVTQEQMAAEIAQVHSLVGSVGLQGSSMSTQGSWGLYGSCFSEPEVRETTTIAQTGRVYTAADAPATIVARGSTKLVWQADGNMVLYDGAVSLWSTQTDGRGTSAIIQGDGNVIVKAGSLVIYQSGAVDATPQEYALTILPNKNLSLFNAAGENKWSALSTAPVPSSVAASGLEISYLATESAALRFQSTDGNLILLNNDKEVWSSGPVGSAGNYKLVFQEDGNLVVRGPGGFRRSVTKNQTMGSSELRLQQDGNLVALKNGKPSWGAR